MNEEKKEQAKDLYLYEASASSSYAGRTDVEKSERLISEMNDIFYFRYLGIAVILLLLSASIFQGENNSLIIANAAKWYHIFEAVNSLSSRSMIWTFKFTFTMICDMFSLQRKALEPLNWLESE